MSENVERRAALQRERAAALAERLDHWLQLTGEERALDVGAGAGAFAFAMAPRVREVVAVELDEALAARARADAPRNVEVVVADGEHLPFERASFDVAGTLRTLHHTPRPELLVAELARVTRPGGTILIVDQLAPADPLVGLELTRFEHARDPSTTRVLADADLRGLFDSNSLKLLREEVVTESRDLEAYLDLAGCEGDAREHARSLAPSGLEAVVGWYLLSR
jgi:ubiquinone/menaquinone biosynthesis C-methylase UbiE